jgi:uncharacterized protein (TIGR02599 family)
MRSPYFYRGARSGAFTLIEMLAAMAVLIVLLGIIVGVTNSVSTTVRRASAGVDALANARTGFDLINRTLSQATLNTYWEYDNPLSPTQYLRQSDLQFVIRQNTQNPGYGQEVFFAAPETYSSNAALRSTRGLLNGCSIFVHFGGSQDFRPSGITADKSRYRLMVGLQPTEQLQIFNRPARTANQAESAYRAAVQTYWDALGWITSLQNGPATVGPAVTPVADNVIALIAWPRLPSSEDPAGLSLISNDSFDYNSQAGALILPQKITANQLPPVIEITMIAISEASAARLDDKSGTPPAAIQTALQGRFEDVSKFRDDLKAVSDALSSAHVEFQIFSTSVPLRESKWSKAQ